jgi:hypothetical protein
MSMGVAHLRALPAGIAHGPVNRSEKVGRGKGSAALEMIDGLDVVAAAVAACTDGIRARWLDVSRHEDEVLLPPILHNVPHLLSADESTAAGFYNRLSRVAENEAAILRV